MEIRGFHVDLKSNLHRFDYLKGFLSVLPQYKINAVLLEWEAKFPFSRDLQDIRHKYCLTRSQADELVKICLRNRIEVIPFIQVLGNLQFLLKHEAFAKIREVPDDARTLCPLNPESIHVVQEMIHQVCKMHPQSLYLHLGGAEVEPFGLMPSMQSVYR